MAVERTIIETPAQMRTVAVADELLKDLVSLLDDTGLITKNSWRMRRLRDALITERYWIIDIVEQYWKENPTDGNKDTNSDS